MSGGLSIAYLMAIEVIVRQVGISEGEHMPKGLTTVEAGDWTLSVNNSGEEVAYGVHGQTIGPWSLVAEHKVYVVIGIFNPVGGAIGGMLESEFIAQMEALGATVPQ